MDPDAPVSKYYGMTLAVPKRPQNKRKENYVTKDFIELYSKTII